MGGWGSGVCILAGAVCTCLHQLGRVFQPSQLLGKDNPHGGGGGGGGVYVQSGEGRKLLCGVPLPPQTFTCNAAHHLHAAWLFLVPYDVCLSLCMCSIAQSRQAACAPTTHPPVSSSSQRLSLVCMYTHELEMAFQRSLHVPQYHHHRSARSTFIEGGFCVQKMHEMSKLHQSKIV